MNYLLDKFLLPSDEFTTKPKFKRQFYSEGHGNGFIFDEELLNLNPSDVMGLQNLHLKGIAELNNSQPKN